MKTSAPKDLVVVAGAAPNTSNLGVSALGYAALIGVRQRFPDVSLAVIDYGLGVRRSSMCVDGQAVELVHLGLRTGRRYYLSSNAARVSLSLRFPFLGNPIADAIRSACVILDVSAGDSFTDLYGRRRFEDIVVPKRLALRANVPFILLPQTYGPFRSERLRATAAAFCRGAAATWARDARSFEILKELLGAQFDPSRHRCGVDMAFLLPADDPGSQLPTAIHEALCAPRGPIAGLNVSGLLYNDVRAARERYAFRADYREACRQIVEGLVDDGAHVVLIPHVGAALNQVESDPRAIDDLHRILSDRARRATDVIPFLPDPRWAKWVVSRCDWFCGMRMHSTIAGLSSGIPTAAISYSPKTLGVFESCGLGDQVADPTELDTADLVAAVLASWKQRTHTLARAKEGARAACAAATQQMDAIASQVRGLAGRRT